ncbi:hypothetical protein D3C78_1884510 [compost metagenome]
MQNFASSLIRGVLHLWHGGSDSSNRDDMSFELNIVSVVTRGYMWPDFASKAIT